MGSLMEAVLLGSCHSMLFYEAGDVAQLGKYLPSVHKELTPSTR